MTHDLRTAPAPAYSVRASEELYRGKIFSLRSDRVRMADGSVATREIVDHPGAVGIVALDEADRVVLIRQYRHSTPGYLWELPAGLLDVADEPAQRAAARELHEEVGLTAATWHTLVDLRTAVGFSNEAVRVFLARDLAEVPDGERYVGEGEEGDLTVARVPLDQAVAATLAGDLENSIAVAGVLAAAWARNGGWEALRPADAPWPARPAAGG